MDFSTPEGWSMIIHTICNIIGLMGNGLLLYLVIRKTPRSIKTYSLLLLNFGVTDFCGCLMAIFVQQRLIPMGSSLLYISSGPCKYFGPYVCYVSYSIMLHCYAHSLWSLFLSFLYRLVVLRSHTPSARVLFACLMFFYSISLFQCVRLTFLLKIIYFQLTFCFASNDPVEMTELLHSRFPEYALENHVVSGNENIFEWKALFTILHMTLPVTPVYTVIIIVRHKIIKTLHGHKMSENTKQMHKQLLNALTFQALLPGLFFIAVVTYALGQTGIYNHPILEYSTFLVVGFLPAVSPLGSMYFIRPYNNWIRRHIIRQSLVEPTRALYSQTHVNPTESTTNYRA